jgi:hypothetical protein
MTRQSQRAIQISVLAWVVALVLAAPQAVHAGQYAISKIAIAGEVAPGAGGKLYGNSFFSVALNDAGEVAFFNDLTGSFPSWGAFLYDSFGGQAVVLSGETAPGTGGGSYLIQGGYPALNEAGEISFMAAVSGGAAASGIFVTPAIGGDLAAVVAGQAAPGTGGGSFDGSLSSLNRHGLNASGVVAFADTVSGGSTASGVFLASGGAHAAVALAGESAPDTGGGVYDDFGAPTLNDAGTVVFPALVAGGSVTGGLFASSAGVDSLLARVGDPAPGTGGTFADFVFPEVNASGTVLFLANLTGSAATGGVFRVEGGTASAVIVELDTAPGTGGGTYATLTGLATLNDAGDVAFSATIAGGTTEAGVFRIDAASGEVVPVVLFGEAAQFGAVDVNDAGQVALQATLSDGNTGIFLASEPMPVPAASTLALMALGAGMLGAARASHRQLTRGGRH